MMLSSRIFCAHPSAKPYREIVSDVISLEASRFGFEAVWVEKIATLALAQDEIRTKISNSRALIALAPEASKYVMFEVALAMGMNRPCLIVTTSKELADFFGNATHVMFNSSFDLSDRIVDLRLWFETVRDRTSDVVR
jgi:hypothetical protein